MHETILSTCSESDAKPFSRVNSYYQKALRSVNPGERLPSVRNVMQECQVSQAVVDRVLAKLQSEGWVEGRPRSGFYRMEKSRRISRAVDFLFFENPEELEAGNFANEFLGCWLANQKPASESLQVHRVREEDRLRAVLADIFLRRPPLVLTMGIDIPHLFALQQLKEHGIQCLNLFPNVEELIFSSLAIHEENVIRTQVEYLVSLGHRKIAYLHPAEETSYHRGFNSRLSSFYKLCVEFRLDVQPEWIRYVGWDPKYIRQQVRQIMSQPNCPTAMIIYDNHVNPIYAELRACGFIPGKDISVVGTDDMPWAAHVDPPLTSLNVPRDQAARIAREMMTEMFSNHAPENHFLQTELVVRESTFPVVGE